MSRAFIREDAGDDELPERPQSSSPNYVTKEGLDALRRRVSELKAALAAAPASKELRRELRYYEGRLARAILVDSSGRAADEARFGATVGLRDASGAGRTVSIVGQDEAEGAPGKISWDSALALALLGAKLGDWVETEQGGVKVETISYPG